MIKNNLKNLSISSAILCVIMLLFLDNSIIIYSGLAIQFVLLTEFLYKPMLLMFEVWDENYETSFSVISSILYKMISMIISGIVVFGYGILMIKLLPNLKYDYVFLKIMLIIIVVILYFIINIAYGSSIIKKHNTNVKKQNIEREKKRSNKG